MESSINQTLESSENQQKNPSSHQLPQIISLPFLISRRLMSLQKQSQEMQQYEQLHSSALNSPSVSKQKIFQNVYNFLNEIVNNSEKEKGLLKRFQQLEHQFETDLKKSNKSIYKLGHMARSMSYAEQQQQIIDVQMKKKSSLRPPPLLNEQNQNENGSLKVIDNINSVRRQLKKKSFQDIAQMNRFCTFQDPVLLEAIESQNSLEQVPPTQEMQKMKIVRFNIDSPEKQKQKMQNRQSLQLSGGREMIREQVFLYKQCSIIMMEEENDKESELFSSEGLLQITDLQLPQISFSIETLQNLFDSPSPFFINFALCIFIKCLIKSKICISKQNVISLLGISTLVSYKAYFDETIDGLIDHFSSILKVSPEKILTLERWFLQTINFEVGVSSEQYQQIMFQLINISK